VDTGPTEFCRMPTAAMVCLNLRESVLHGRAIRRPQCAATEHLRRFRRKTRTCGDAVGSFRAEGQRLDATALADAQARRPRGCAKGEHGPDDGHAAAV
jgi:hypothetical protein